MAEDTPISTPTPTPVAAYPTPAPVESTPAPAAETPAESSPEVADFRDSVLFGEEPDDNISSAPAEDDNNSSAQPTPAAEDPAPEPEIDAPPAETPAQEPASPQTAYAKLADVEKTHADILDKIEGDKLETVDDFKAAQKAMLELFKAQKQALEETGKETSGFREQQQRDAQWSQIAKSFELPKAKVQEVWRDVLVDVAHTLDKKHGLRAWSEQQLQAQATALFKQRIADAKKPAAPKNEPKKVVSAVPAGTSQKARGVEPGKPLTAWERMQRGEYFPGRQQAR